MNILYYASFERVDCKNVNPKYRMTSELGFYKGMKDIVGRDGRVSLTLLDTERISSKASAPSKFLLAKGGLNFTGLKNYTTSNGELNDYCYGYPYSKETYSSKNKLNPFYDRKEDAFLFIINKNLLPRDEAEKHTPKGFELLVVDGGKPMIGAYFNMLKNNQLKEQIEASRKQAIILS